MELTSITIKNYRSIEELHIPIKKLDDESRTFSLIGINEAGKSSILKAIALKDGLTDEKGEKLPYKKDFKDTSKPIEIIFEYTLDAEDEQDIFMTLYESSPTDENNEHIGVDFNVKVIKIVVSFDYTNPVISKKELVLDVPINGDEESIKKISEYIFDCEHKTIFWTTEDRYIISRPIDIATFKDNPLGESIPLRNSFMLAGINTVDIPQELEKMDDSGAREFLRDELGKAVTNHIKKVWKEHPIKITFDISESQISFHVHDEGVNEKAKTADQRSDGFRQFISFLLTVSAENKSGALSDTILLLDEPETHLHPKAQENLLNDLIQITSEKERNNTAFFATHSNYMIDKKDLGRNMKIKKDNNKTKLEFFNTKESTYGSVNYEVFDILSTDYHNELYAKLHELYQNEDESDEARVRILNFDDNFLSKNGKGQSQDKPWKEDKKRVTLSTYIRNCIHHPDNGNTYSEEEMRISIIFLRKCLLDQ